MKRIISLAALYMTATLALAQTAPAAPPPAGDRMERMALLLDLNDGQKVAVEKVLTEQRQEMIAQHKAARESGTRPSREEMKAKFAAEHAATIEKLRPILSDVQLKKFEALTDHPPGRPRGFGMRPDKATAQ